MEIEKPKVQHNADNNPNEVSELGALCAAVFERNPEGKRVLAKLKELYISNKYTATVFPANPNTLQQFGSTEAYAGFRSGQANVVFHIEHLIEYHKKEEANRTKPMKEDKIIVA